MSPRRSAADAAHTREAIVARAIQIASVEGLEGVTIGRLASDLQMSKAGVLGRFGTKQELQLTALEAAIEVFRREVWEPSAAAAPGLARLEAICGHWISYLERPVFPGGCFLTAASCEFDGRKGPVHDAIEHALRLWLRTLQAEAQTAIAAGELPPDSNPAVIAFQLNSVAMGANQALQLLADSDAVPTARTAMRQTLGLGQPQTPVNPQARGRKRRRPLNA
ncbi:MAG: TetR/AcrR family transcriptional regulator [Steroidobacteraceae bacterium]